MVRASVRVPEFPTDEEQQTLKRELPIVFGELEADSEMKDIALPTYFVEDAIKLAFMGVESQPEPGQSSRRGVLGESKFGVYQRKVYEIAERIRPGFRDK